MGDSDSRSSPIPCDWLSLTIGLKYEKAFFFFQRLYIHPELNILSSQVAMDLSPSWLSEMEMEDTTFMNYDQMSTLYDTIDVDDFNVDPFFSEPKTDNSKFIDQSFKKTCTNTIKKRSPTPQPRITTSLPSSNTFTISFGGDLKPKKEILHVHDHSHGATKIPTISRNPFQAQDHVLAERRRREKLNQHFVSISSLLPNLKKMDKASVLEDASNYIKQLQSRVKELEGLSGAKRKNDEESVISIKRSRLSSSDDEYTSSDESNSGESTDLCNLSPEIEVRMSGNSVLVRIQCQKNYSSLVKALTQIQNLGLSIISSSAIPFAKTTLLINIVAQIEDEFCMTATELVKNLQLAI
ncbi:hypothetical protein LXL04_006932 [Taraxacum kok-saghyz]